ncbi:hypothetical protein RhiirA4_545840 [Rhizophagus irregularis]|uniref:Uncharacterized protein n=1 Tax=Rhizophagus irregularis TaxID=588596 RepID=A0A2I1GUE9_9GLOM|nr:hypothetical protein RhiirA4_545840 [Rhizophagus irregularis]
MEDTLNACTTAIISLVEYVLKCIKNCIPASNSNWHHYYHSIPNFKQKLGYFKSHTGREYNFNYANINDHKLHHTFFPGLKVKKASNSNWHHLSLNFQASSKNWDTLSHILVEENIISTMRIIMTISRITLFKIKKASNSNWHHHYHSISKLQAKIGILKSHTGREYNFNYANVNGHKSHHTFFTGLKVKKASNSNWHYYYHSISKLQAKVGVL